MQGTFLLSHLLTRVAFELDASCSFINASCVIGLGLKVEAFREMMRDFFPRMSGESWSDVSRS